MSNTTTQSFLQEADTTTVKEAAKVLRAINHPLRRNMLHTMNKKGSINVTDLYVALRLEQSVASQHLAILRGAGLVETERKGKEILYSVKYSNLNKTLRLSGELAGLQPNK